MVRYLTFGGEVSESVKGVWLSPVVKGVWLNGAWLSPVVVNVCYGQSVWGRGSYMASVQVVGGQVRWLDRVYLGTKRCGG